MDCTTCQSNILFPIVKSREKRIRKLFYKKEKMPVFGRTAPFIVFERKARDGLNRNSYVRRDVLLEVCSPSCSPIEPLHLGCTQECQAPTNHLPLCAGQHHIGLGALPCMWGACAAPRGTGAQPLGSARSGATRPQGCTPHLWGPCKAACVVAVQQQCA